jgi:DNA helicase II / ATP-dependent DNA helicase PcrA
MLPAGDDSVRDLRDLATRVLADIGEGDREAWLFELLQEITRPEVPSQIADVRIMSLHKSKGLSAPVTVIAGCVEGLLPRQPDRETPLAEQQAMIEEQRRLFFVAISRVKADPAAGKPGTLILTSSRQMPLAAAMGAGIRPASTQFGVARLNASRFLRELGPDAPQPVAG